MDDMTFISCPHLESSEDGCGDAMADGMVVFLNHERTQVLILCNICSELVRSEVLTSLLSKSVSNVLRSNLHG